ncbi:uncharacterized protein LOC120837130 isoform X2 [Ixodes scapularis]|uniref:uncharacterized protein LOC120837130 isoform X2 n=1 Tax=Ixodes scapularis TaxID=6945 RepID=UPI001A9D50E9|nr:uncharacterized protein LOC120837130 isoform X2 [Ixodes scapularis]
MELRMKPMNPTAHLSPRYLGPLTKHHCWNPHLLPRNLGPLTKPHCYLRKLSTPAPSQMTRWTTQRIPPCLNLQKTTSIQKSQVKTTHSMTPPMRSLSVEWKEVCHPMMNVFVVGG